MKFIGIFTTCFAVFFTLQAAWAAGPTYVQNNISVSTEWVPDNSPYVIQDDVTVSPGAVLTIDPGVLVRFMPLSADKSGTGPNLIIEGALKAVADPTTPISFVSSVPGGQWGALYFFNCDSANSILDGCKITGGRISCNGSSPTISNCSITGSKRGIEISAHSQAKILGNRIRGNGYGLVLISDTASPIVQNNEIFGNKYGVYLKDFRAPTITKNRIYDNLQYNVVNETPKALDIPNNNFNTGITKEIARSIYDGANNPTLGRLNYLPYIVTTASAAPANAPVLARATVSTAKTPALASATVSAVKTPAPAGAPVSAAVAPSKQAKPAVIHLASTSSPEGGFTPKFGLSLDLTGQGAFGNSKMGSSGGVGGALFADWRPIEYISLGVGFNYINFPGSESWQVGPVDLGGRLFPFGSGKDGEGYLQGGLGYNLITQTFNYMTPGYYHMYAGGGYRAFIFGPGMALDLGLQFNYYSRSTTSSPLYDTGVKAGLACFFDLK